VVIGFDGRHPKINISVMPFRLIGWFSRRLQCWFFQSGVSLRYTPLKFYFTLYYYRYRAIILALFYVVGKKTVLLAMLMIAFSNPNSNQTTPPTLQHQGCLSSYQQPY
jgi:hypothetical protein